MSFQSYLQNIKAQTGKGPEDFHRLAAEKGFTTGDTIKEGVKAGDIVAWFKQDFGLGHGHAMAMYALLKGTNLKTATNFLVLSAAASHVSTGRVIGQRSFPGRRCPTD
jgi:hypothetical protein